jgi:hypothetical protein
MSFFSSLGINLWLMYGTGIECICRIDIATRPNATSNAQMKNRETELGGKCVKLVWHPQAHFEIVGTRSVKLGEADFAVQDLQICYNTEQAESLAKQGYALIKDLVKIGFHGVSIWCKGRKAENEDLLFKFNRVQSQPWCDNRLIRIMKSVNLTEDDVMRLRRIFENMLFGRDRETLRVEEFFAFIVREDNFSFLFLFFFCCAIFSFSFLLLLIRTFLITCSVAGSWQR